MRKMLIARCWRGGLADRRAGRDRQHPDGGRAGHANTSRRCCRSSRRRPGIDVNLEVVNYAEMHTKLVPQLVAPRAAIRRSSSTSTGSANSPRRAGCSRSTSASRRQDRYLRLRPGDDGPGRQGRRRHLYAALLQLRHGPDSTAKTSSPTPKNKATSRRSTAWTCACPTTWDEYLKQVEYFTKDGMSGRRQPGPAP